MLIQLMAIVSSLKKKPLYFHIVDLRITTDSYYFYLQQCVLFLNILLRYNALFTYTSKNTSLITDIIFSAFLMPDKNLGLFECPADMWSVLCEDHLSS
jgi:hypothetical protein